MMTQWWWQWDCNNHDNNHQPQWQVILTTTTTATATMTIRTRVATTTSLDNDNHNGHHHYQTLTLWPLALSCLTTCSRKSPTTPPPPPSMTTPMTTIMTTMLMTITPTCWLASGKLQGSTFVWLDHLLISTVVWHVWPCLASLTATVWFGKDASDHQTVRRSAYHPQIVRWSLSSIIVLAHRILFYSQTNILCTSRYYIWC